VPCAGTNPKYILGTSPAVVQGRLQLLSPEAAKARQSPHAARTTMLLNYNLSADKDRKLREKAKIVLAF